MKESVAEGFSPDTQLVPFVFSDIRSTGVAFQGVPIEILDPNWLIKKYKDAGLIRIYTEFS